jgi:AraC-like DNA-binding protein
MGRAKKTINWKQFNKLIKGGFTLEKIADFFECSASTIENIVLREKNKNFCDYLADTLKKGRYPNNGRPQIKINWDVVDKLCGIFCTLEEIAAFCECSEDTIEKAVIKEKGMKFKDYYKIKCMKGKISLRRMQYKQAEKNPTMAIWLGKQFLGQEDSKKRE